jgi:hydrogenase nickel incorporation protein HypB
MCTTCGCGAGETRLEDHASHEHEHRHADGTVHSHAHVHAGEHAHGHDEPHEHVMPDGSVLRHAHGAGGGHAPGHVAAQAPHEHLHTHADGTAHSHPHVHQGEHTHDHAATGTASDMHFGLGPAGAHAPGMSQTRMVQIEQDILAKNDRFAARNRQTFADRGVLALNLVSSPGSGKTTLLVRTIEALAGRLPAAVVEGDQQTSVDADRIRTTGVPAVQINTGKGCHLDASMIGSALDRLALADDSVLFIENVGNLVCPAGFDLGEAAKVVVLSVTEGEDKPLKYPDMFRAAQLMLLNKIDLLPHLTFDVERCIGHARQVNPTITVIGVSAITGDGCDEWLRWLETQAADAQARRRETVAALRRRVAELEAQLAGVTPRT